MYYEAYAEFKKLPLNERKTRALICDPVVLAYQWIEAYADSLSGHDYDRGDITITAEGLIDTAISNLESRSQWSDDYISHGGLLEGVSTDPLFWKKLEVLLGISIPSNKQNNFFSCSC